MMGLSVRINIARERATIPVRITWEASSLILQRKSSYGEAITRIYHTWTRFGGKFWLLYVLLSSVFTATQQVSCKTKTRTFCSKLSSACLNFKRIRKMYIVTLSHVTWYIKLFPFRLSFLFSCEVHETSSENHLIDIF